MREVEAVVECGGSSDLSDFDPPMLERGVLDELRFRFGPGRSGRDLEAASAGCL